MIAELQFGTSLLRPTLQEASVGELVIEQLDAADDVPLRTICWIGDHHRPEIFETALADDSTVADMTHIVETDFGSQYQITFTNDQPGTGLYTTAVEHDGVFVSGMTDGLQWELKMRFPDRESLSAFRLACEHADFDLSVRAVHDQDTVPHAAEYGLSPAQREILLLAVARGYFAVPRDASLADLSDELDISSQAASERLRRGLDSLVESALLVSE